MKKSKIFITMGLLVMVALALVSCGNPYSKVDLDDYIKVATYKGLEVTPIEVSVSDDDVTAEINNRLQAAATTKSEKSGTVKKGDTIKIDYVGTISGKEFDGGSADDYSLTIGSGQFIDGFEDGLIGSKVGAKKTLDLTFPDDYGNTDLAGKDVEFKVTINSIEKTVVPEFDEDFVVENSDVKTIKEYKATVKKELEEDQKKAAEQSQEATLWSQVVSDSTVKTDKEDKEKYPEDRLKAIQEDTTSFYEDAAKSSNMEFADYLTQNFGMDEDTFKEQVVEYSKILCKEEMVMYKIADKESIKVSGKEVDQYVTDTLAQYGYTEETFEKANDGKSFEDIEGKDKIEQNALKAKVQKFIVENAKESDK